MSEAEKQKLIDLCDKLEMENRIKDKVIDKMAEDMATDYHSKEWIIKHYTERINDERNQDKI